ncbi:uncharacterized protein [Argopecten irradians]|uniref:uncharacterized protein n=1 Tax=Argopecten irradians TaxID=31199 RepID=UPI003713DC3C
MASNDPLPADQCGQIPVRVKGNSQCTAHKNKEVILQCLDCNILICITCSITTHNGHQLAEMNDIIPRKRDILRDFVNDAENNKLIQIREEIKSIDDKITEIDTKFVDLAKQMKQQSEICKKKLDDLTDEFVILCDKMEKENRELLFKYKRELKQRYKLLVRQVKECKEVLQSGTSVDLFDTASGLSMASLTLPNEPKLNDVEFRPCASPSKKLRNALGSLHKHRHEPRSDNVDTADTATSDEFLEQPTVLTEFKSPMECAQLCPNPFGTWLSEAESKVLMLVDFHGQIIEKVKHSCEITDISVSPKTHNVWFCCAENKTIYEYSSSNANGPMFETESCPACLCVTKDEQIVVWTKDPDFLHERVLILTTEGKVIFSTCLPEQETWAVRTPFTVTQCRVTGNLAFLCRGSTHDDDPCGKISVYNQDAIFLFAYDGTTDASGQQSFVPWSVVYDSKGYMVVGDEQGNKIQLISGTGLHLRTIRFGVQTDNLALGIHPDDVLWLCFFSSKAEKVGIFGKVVRKLSESSSDIPKPEIKTMKYYK